MKFKWFLLGFIIVFAVKFFLRLQIDEREHLHFAYLVYKNYIPYKDFYEHHMPLIWEVFSIPMFVAGFVPKVIMARGLQSLIIVTSAYFFSKTFQKNQVFIFLGFCLMLTMPNPIPNFGDIRPELLVMLFFTIAWYLFSSKKFDNPLFPLILYLGMLSSPRFFPVFLVLGLASLRSLSLKTILSSALLLGLLTFLIHLRYGIDNLIFFVVKSTSESSRFYLHLMRGSWEYFAVLYFSFFFAYSIYKIRTIKVLPILYLASALFLCTERIPFYSQSFLVLYLISFYYIFQMDLFQTKKVKILFLSTLVAIGISVKFIWYFLGQHHYFTPKELTIFQKLYQKYEGTKVYYSFEKGVEDNFVAHPIFVEDITYFGFINDQLLTPKHYREIIKFTKKSKSELLDYQSKPLLVDEEHFQQLKSILNEMP